jgi:hypothetical protein
VHFTQCRGDTGVDRRHHFRIHLLTLYTVQCTVAKNFSVNTNWLRCTVYDQQSPLYSVQCTYSRCQSYLTTHLKATHRLHIIVHDTNGFYCSVSLRIRSPVQVCKPIWCPLYRAHALTLFIVQCVHKQSLPCTVRTPTRSSLYRVYAALYSLSTPKNLLWRILCTSTRTVHFTAYSV